MEIPLPVEARPLKIKPQPYVSLLCWKRNHILVLCNDTFGLYICMKEQRGKVIPVRAQTLFPLPPTLQQCQIGEHCIHVWWWIRRLHQGKGGGSLLGWRWAGGRHDGRQVSSYRKQGWDPALLLNPSPIPRKPVAVQSFVDLCSRNQWHRSE